MHSVDFPTSLSSAAARFHTRTSPLKAPPARSDGSSGWKSRQVRHSGSSSAECLRQLSMSQRSNGVFINDPKGLFILRWYREVKGDGTPPDGPRYQNRACKYYKLTSDNDGEAFRWTSNYQIISKVYLKKHSSLPLCYSLSAADKKMVTSTMKKMVGPEAE